MVILYLWWKRQRIRLSRHPLQAPLQITVTTWRGNIVFYDRGCTFPLSWCMQHIFLLCCCSHSTKLAWLNMWGCQELHLFSFQVAMFTKGRIFWLYSYMYLHEKYYCPFLVHICMYVCVHWNLHEIFMCETCVRLCMVIFILKLTNLWFLLSVSPVERNFTFLAYFKLVIVNLSCGFHPSSIHWSIHLEMFHCIPFCSNFMSIYNIFFAHVPNNEFLSFFSSPNLCHGLGQLKLLVQ